MSWYRKLITPVSILNFSVEGNVTFSEVLIQDLSNRDYILKKYSTSAPNLTVFNFQVTQAQPLGWEDPLKKEMATHSSTLAWKIPRDWGGPRVGGKIFKRLSQKTSLRKWHLRGTFLVVQWLVFLTCLPKKKVRFEQRWWGRETGEFYRKECSQQVNGECKGLEGRSPRTMAESKPLPSPKPALPPSGSQMSTACWGIIHDFLKIFISLAA